MKITDSFPKFYYEYYDSDGKLKSIEQDEFSNFIGITNPSEIAYLMCCRIPVPLDDDQKVIVFVSNFKSHEKIFNGFLIVHFCCCSVFFFFVLSGVCICIDANFYPRTSLIGVS